MSLETKNYIYKYVTSNNSCHQNNKALEIHNQRHLIYLFLLPATKQTTKKTRMKLK